MSLLAEERKKVITELIEEHGQVKVNDLAAQFTVSTETIRRYLEELEGEKKLKKVYGGAVKMETAEPSMFEREILRMEEKKRIGSKAASFVKEGEVIFIDEGSTTLQMCAALKDIFNITVITNSFPLATILMDYESKQLFHGEIIFLGGQIRSKHFRASGSLTEKMAKEFYADKAFIAIDGIHKQAGLTSFDIEKCLLSKIFIENANTSFILVDHSKIDVKANYKIVSLESADYILSDVQIPEEWGMEDKWIKC
ncbi:DeoR/GlpR family DNA-binding transcription regulator [Metabacillus fastidiosus]|uniref:DeoR/GlpR family DNA-binding transcription regulator n=1 Tax=Metabacillus fastidiosus TaxID=1458 RepID=A0ABU6NY98_9BACI|nr:DeoR/GlpR family DNA-binding transcription regulator [Metabacillus fastidiosus]MED4401845.1 DeoR/GlpR family DNA-binding transcription regulator [Metabacillus fastidiosus]MED4452595.1 DeoR/GlpR family DNA-binding transcription regulator [Metabacillus fastidiosus]MED4463474.1 DeoR/GlpR family DNA-binding transcription regulator [Metabacillus fastidiosus]